MPPRRSCFVILVAGGNPDVHSFNATTAFLLQWMEQGRELAWDRFNATTAFLLPMVFAAMGVRYEKVSMPPRRSCFDKIP